MLVSDQWGHEIENCIARPGIMSSTFVGMHFVSMVLVMMVIPLDLGLSWSWEWMKARPGLYLLLRESIWRSSEWDSTVQRRAIFFWSIDWVVLFHLFRVDGLLAPLMFREAIYRWPISCGFME